MRKYISRFFVQCRLGVVFAGVAGLMLLFELIKGVFIPENASIWVSHALTILFSATLATLVTFLLRRTTREVQLHADLILESLAEGIYGTDTQGNCTFVNPAFLHILGYQHADEVLSRHIHELIHHSHADGTAYPATECRIYQAYRRNVKIHVDDEVFWRRDGTPVEVEYWSYPIHRNGQMLGVVATFLDITERKKAEAALQLSEQRFRDVSDAAGEYVWEMDTNMVYSYVSARAKAVKGYTPEQLLGHSPLEFMPQEDREGVTEIVKRAMTDNTHFTLQHRDITPTGEVVWEEVHGISFYDSKGALIGLRGTGMDISERKQKEHQVHRQAFYDTLTKLPNRRLLGERLLATLNISERTRQYGALMFLDLDNFKPLNDQHGHVVGDLLLIEVARRLKSCIRKVDMAARFGGDEFVVLLCGLSARHDEAIVQARQLAEKIRSRVSEVYRLTSPQPDSPESLSAKLPDEAATGVIEHRCTLSIGVAMFIDHLAGEQEILKQADAAMYDAKNSGRNAVCFYAEPAPSATNDYL